MLAGACYLVIVVALWEMFAVRFRAPLPIGAVSLLIAVCATLDLDDEVRAICGATVKPETQQLSAAR